MPTNNEKLYVLAVGDCNTHGIEEPPAGNTILDKYCRRLAELGIATESQNLGFGMGCTREGVQLMRLDAKPADIVLINFGLVDTWRTSIPSFYVPYYPEYRSRKLLRKLLKYVKRRLRSPLARRLVSVGPVVPPDEYAANIREMIDLARRQNPMVQVLLWGSPPVQHDPERNVALDTYNRILASVAAETESLYVDTTKVVDAIAADEAYLDDVHLNEAATQAIADALLSASHPIQLEAAG